MENTFITVFLGIALLSLTLFLLFRRLQRKAAGKTIPGLAPTLPEDGNLPDIGQAGSMHQFLLQLHQR